MSPHSAAMPCPAEPIFEFFDEQQGKEGVAQHDLQRGDLAIGPQHVKAIEARVFGDPRLVDGEVLGRDGF